MIEWAKVPEDKDNTVGKYWDYLNFRHIALAVLIEYQLNLIDTSSIKANSELCTSNSLLLNRLYERVKLRWMQLSELDETWWPYNKDCVTRLYIKYRKRTLQELEKYAQELREC